MSQWRRPAAATAVAVIALSWPALAKPALINRACAGSGGWRTAVSAPGGCELPYVTADSTSSSTGLDEAAIVLGDNRPSLAPGCDPSYILQDFDCESSSAAGAYCTVTFEASLWRVPGERAAVIIADGRSPVIFEIPGDRVGRSGRYAISVLAGARARLSFAVWRSPGSPRGTRSVLLLKNVECRQTGSDIGSPELTPLPAEAMPIDVGGLEGQLLPKGPGIADCNRDAIPDEYEITQGMAVDGNGDGWPDECAGKKRQIDWVLLGLGIVLLLVTLLRAGRHRRRK